MKLLSFELNGTQSVGVATDKGIVDLASHLPAGVTDLKSLLETGLFSLGIKEIVKKCTDFIDTDSVTFLPVIPNTCAIFCMGMNTKSHCAEIKAITGKDNTPKIPQIFMRTARAQVGHGQALELPNGSPLFDYEGEIAIVIGKFGRHIKEEDALDHIAGYSCYNDGSIRDYQFHSSMYTAGKNFNNTAGFGPWLVTSDEIGSPDNLSLETRVNGKVVQTMPYDDLIFDFKAIISYISQWTELHPGDVIVTGSAAGVIVASKEQNWLKDGDTVEVQVKGVGTLSNQVKMAEGRSRGPVTRDNAKEVFAEAMAMAMRNH